VEPRICEEDEEKTASGYPHELALLGVSFKSIKAAGKQKCSQLFG
jgi:hypothetical protein